MSDREVGPPSGDIELKNNTAPQDLQQLDNQRINPTQV